MRAALAALLCTALLTPREPAHAQQRATAVDGRTLAALLAAGDSAWAKGDHPAAFRAFDAIVRADSAFSTRALFRVGTLHAWNDRFDQAVASHRLYVKLEPADLEGRVALGRTYAWASRFPASIAQYDTVLARDPDYRDALLGRATALAWWGRLPAAIEELAQWQRAHPDDREAALLRARFVSWSGQLDDALALYDSLSAGGASPEAENGRARVLAWRGDLGGAEAMWRSILARRPDDAEAWVGLGQVLRWQGRSFAARDAIGRALTLDPSSNDAREQLRWLRPETSPAVTTAIVHTDDSENNRSTTLEVGGTFVDPRQLRFTGSVRWRSVSQGSLDALEIPAVLGGAQWQPRNGAWTLRLTAGAVQYPEALSASTTSWQGGFGVSGRLGTRFTLGANVSRTPFDEILAAAARRLSMASYDAEVGATLHPRVAAALAVTTATVQGDMPMNDRRTALMALRWTPVRSLRASLTHREVAWDHPAPGVYFAPERFAITEVSTLWEWPRDLGLVMSAEAGVGSQVVEAGGDASRRVAPRGSLRLGWRPVPGREIVASFQLANVASAGAVTGSEYRYGAVSLFSRWTF